MRIRTLLATVAVFGLLTWLWILIRAAPTTVWVGKPRLLYVSFLVLDQNSDMPIGNAVIRCLDADIPERGTIYNAETDECGHAAIVEERIVYGSSNLFVEAQSISYPSWGFRVSHDGYETAEVISLWDCIGLGGDPKRGGLRPPPIVVRLKRVGLGRR
jgi:hypothetical protein